MATAAELPQQQQKQQEAILQEIQMHTETVPPATSAQGKAQLKAGESGETTVHPSPSTFPAEATTKTQTATTTTTTTPTTTTQQKPDVVGTEQSGPMLDPFQAQLVTAFSFIVFPVGMTIWRGYYSNGGPTWFSLHPLMMLTSIVTLSGTILAQRLGGANNSRMGLLAYSASCAVLMGFFAVWAAKEAFAKPHFVSMHSHLGGMTLGGILTYALAVPLIYNPFSGELRNRKHQKYLEMFGKGIAGMGLFTMMVGMVEIERSWLMLLLWIASLVLFVPFLVI